MLLNWIIGIGAVGIVFFTGKRFIKNAKEGKEEGCGGHCASCSGCSSFNKKITH